MTPLTLTTAQIRQIVRRQGSHDAGRLLWRPGTSLDTTGAGQERQIPDREVGTRFATAADAHADMLANLDRPDAPAPTPASEVLPGQATPVDYVAAMRRDTWRLQRHMRKLTTNRRRCACRAQVADADRRVEVVQSAAGLARYRGLWRCGSAWSCPLCGNEIARRQRDMLRELLKQVDGRGHVVTMVTLTLKHEHDEPMSAVYKRLRRAMRAFWQDTRLRKCVGDDYGYVGRITGIEALHGAHGWHVHAHVLVVSHRSLNIPPQEATRTREADTARDFREYAGDLWRRAVANAGGYCFAEFGFWTSANKANETQEERERRITYPARWDAASELAGVKHDGHGRSIWSILEGATKGSAYDRRLWHEHESCTSGKTRLKCSPGLLAEYGLDEDELDGSDHLPEEVAEGQVVLELTNCQWSAVRRFSAEYRLLWTIEHQGIGCAMLLMEDLVSRYMAGRRE